MNRILATLAVALILLGLISLTSTLHAEYGNITQADVGPTLASTLTAPSGTFTFRTFMPKQVDNPKTGLSRQVTQSALFSAVGTSPNYKVEVLCSMDGVVFTKPETGGDLGTFTDSNNHFVPINTPLSPGGHQLKFTELGAANSVTWTETEASQ